MQPLSVIPKLVESRLRWESVCEYLKFPEDAACMSVIVVPQRDVLHPGGASPQVALHVLKEPGFEVQADSVNLTSTWKRGG